MKTRILLLTGCFVMLATLGLALSQARAEDAKKDTPATKPADVPDGWVALDLKLPKPVFAGTPKNLPPGVRFDPNASKGPRPAFFAPPGTKNLALNKPVTSSDSEPIIGSLKMLTDGDKEATDGSYVELGPGLQWVQIDLGAVSELQGILVFHFHSDPRVYKGVVVQVAEDADFITGVKTLFNNDHENITGLGIGKDFQYFETNEGKLIECRGAKARYLRCYSKGSTADGQNHYTEVEVYGTPAK